MSAYATPRAMCEFKKAVSNGASLKDAKHKAAAAYIAADLEYERGCRAHLESKEKRKKMRKAAVAVLCKKLTPAKYLAVRDGLMYKRLIPADVASVKKA